MKEIMTFDGAVRDYIDSLEPERRQRLRDAVLNSQSAESWPWFEEVIDRYKLRDPGSAVSVDLHNMFPDPYGVNNFLLTRGDEPIFEAEKFLDAVQAKLRAAA